MTTILKPEGTRVNSSTLKLRRECLRLLSEESAINGVSAADLLVAIQENLPGFLPDTYPKLTLVRTLRGMVADALVMEVSKLRFKGVVSYRTLLDEEVQNESKAYEQNQNDITKFMTWTDDVVTALLDTCPPRKWMKELVPMPTEVEALNFSRADTEEVYRMSMRALFDKPVDKLIRFKIEECTDEELEEELERRREARREEVKKKKQEARQVIPVVKGKIAICGPSNKQFQEHKGRWNQALGDKFELCFVDTEKAIVGTVNYDGAVVVTRMCSRASGVVTTTERRSKVVKHIASIGQICTALSEFAA